MTKKNTQVKMKWIGLTNVDLALKDNDVDKMRGDLDVHKAQLGLI